MPSHSAEALRIRRGPVQGSPGPHSVIASPGRWHSWWRYEEWQSITHLKMGVTEVPLGWRHLCLASRVIPDFCGRREEWSWRMFDGGLFHNTVDE